MKIIRFANLGGQLASVIVQDGQIKLIERNTFGDRKPSNVKLE